MRMKQLIILLNLLMISVFVSGQEYSKEHKKTLREADVLFDFEDYNSAIKLYSMVYKDYINDPYLNYKLGVSYFNMGRFQPCEQFFKKSYTDYPESFYYLAGLAHLNNELELALDYYKKYKMLDGEKEKSSKEINRMIDKVKFARSAQKNEKNVTIENVGKTINTEHHEYVPLIAADESMMLFTSRRPGSTGDVLDPNERFFEDIYVSYQQNNAWGTPKKLNSMINTPTNDACVGLSADAQVLFIFRTNEDLISGDLYESRMGLDDWEQPVKLGSNINSEYIESSASLAPNDRTIYFSSDREGGYGGKDIYKVEMLPNGQWAKAVNMGPVINTPYDEDAPFIHSDGKTLYFSSRAHKNMGGYDIFRSEMSKDGNWGIPVNMGYPINTVDDDVFFVLGADGKVGYYSSSQEGGYGGQDIYKINFNDEIVQLEVVKGLITSNDSISTPIAAKITLIDNQSKKVQGIYRSKENTGKFIVLIAPEKSYKVIVEAKDHHSFTTELDGVINQETGLKFKLNQLSE